MQELNLAYVAVTRARKHLNAVALQNEIKNTVKENWNFEHREKYKDAIGLEKDRIAAARAVGVAYGNNQKPTTTYINWIR